MRCYLAIAKIYGKEKARWLAGLPTKVDSEQEQANRVH
jgi:hypothetical protein